MASLFKDDSRFAPSQWETVLLCNDVSHWLGASLESTLLLNQITDSLNVGLRSVIPEVCCELLLNQWVIIVKVL